MLTLQVEVALHQVEFAVHLRETRLWLDDNKPVHTAGDVLRHHGRRTVIHVHTWIESLKLETAILTGRDLHHFGSSTWPGDCVQVDAVCDPSIRSIVEVDLDCVALAPPKHTTRHC